MLLFASLVMSCTIALTPLEMNAALESPHRHVRSQDRAVKQLLKRGYTHSYTFRSLMSRLDRTDVIVYIQQVATLPGRIDGRMMMPTVSHGQRYVRIQILMRGNPDEEVALLGHELQHALEVADEAGVQDQASLTALYERIGQRGGLHVYDTYAAQEVGRVIRRELLA